MLARKPEMRMAMPLISVIAGILAFAATPKRCTTIRLA